MRLKRLVSGSMALCLVTLATLSAPIEARAAAQDLLATRSNAKPVVIDPEPTTQPMQAPDVEELEEDDLEDIIGMGANRIEDFDPDSLVPLTPEEIEYARTHENAVPNLDNEVSPQIALEVTGLAIGLAYVALYCYSSAQTLTSNNSTASTLEMYASRDDSWSYSLTYKHNNKVETKVLTAKMFKAVMDKLDTLKDGVAQTLTLTQEDREALAAVFGGSSKLVNVDTKSVDIKAIDDYKYYYFTVNNSSYAPSSINVIFTKQPVSYARRYNGKLYFYQYIAAAKDPFQPLDSYDTKYNLSTSTGMYEFASKTFFSSASGLKIVTHNDRDLPFLIIPDSRDSNFKGVYGSAAMLDYSDDSKSLSMDALMDLGSIAIPSDVSSTLSDDRNAYGVVTGFNQGAGTILGGEGTETKPGETTKPGEATKPGESTGTGESGSTSSPDYSGPLTNIIGIITSILAAVNVIPNIFTIIQSISTLFGALPDTIKTSIVNALASIPYFQSVLDYLSDITSGIEDVAAAAGVDVSPVTNAIRGVWGDVTDIGDAVSDIRSDVAGYRDAITGINSGVAAIPGAITGVGTDVKSLSDVVVGVGADVKAIPGVVAGLGADVRAIPGTITGVGTAVGEKVDALPASIAGAIAGTIGLTEAQSAQEWGVSSPFINKFPFSIPWDIAGCVNLLVASPVKPVWKIPFKIDNPAIKIDQEVVIDLSGDEWSGPVKVLRTFILILFVVALAAITRNLIRG